MSDNVDIDVDIEPELLKKLAAEHIDSLSSASQELFERHCDDNVFEALGRALINEQVLHLIELQIKRNENGG